jgi:hypothetical protein
VSRSRGAAGLYLARRISTRVTTSTIETIAVHSTSCPGRPRKKLDLAHRGGPPPCRLDGRNSPPHRRESPSGANRLMKSIVAVEATWTGTSPNGQSCERRSCAGAELGWSWQPFLHRWPLSARAEQPANVCRPLPDQRRRLDVLLRGSPRGPLGPSPRSGSRGFRPARRAPKKERRADVAPRSSTASSRSSASTSSWS